MELCSTTVLPHDPGGYGLVPLPVPDIEDSRVPTTGQIEHRSGGAVAPTGPFADEGSTGESPPNEPAHHWATVIFVNHSLSFTATMGLKSH